MSDSAQGKWISAGEFARILGISEQTLANWRHKEKRLGKRPSGAPRWIKVGSVIRYWLPRELADPEAP